MHVMLVHGVMDTARLFNRMAQALQQAGFQPHALDLVPNTGAAPLERYAEQLAGAMAREVPAEAPCVLVGYSMGGIVSRYYLHRMDGLTRVCRFISIAAPQRGTLTACLSARQLRGCRQMRAGSDFLRDLDRDVDLLSALHPLSVWTPFDLMVFPARNSILPGSRAIGVPVLSHLWMPRSQRVIRLVLRECQDASESV